MESTQVTISTVIFIVSLIIPGILFKKFYYQGQFTKQFSAGLFADRLISSIFLGILVQILTFLVFTRYFHFKYESVKLKMDTAYASIVDNKIPDFTYPQLLYIFSYLAFLSFMSIFLGCIFHFFIRYFKLDVRYNVLRFSNKWNYLIRGDILSTREFRGRKRGKIDSTMVDVIIDDATEKNKLITGFLTDYTISHKTGELESIHLTAAKRYSQTNNTYKEIPGDCLIIPCHRMVNMNLRYILKVVDKKRQKALIFAQILLASIIIGWVCIIAFIWHFKVGAISKLFAIISFMISWMLLIIFATNPFHPNTDVKISKESIYITLLLTIIFFLIGCFLII